MSTKLQNGDSVSSIKRIRLNNETCITVKGNETSEHSKIIKLEPTPVISSNSESVSSEGSKDILLKIYPVYNVSEKSVESSVSNSNHKSVQFYFTNCAKLCSQDENIQVKVNNDVSRKSKFHENISQMRPSEALFVRCLLPHCKRLAPLWFKGVSSMRDKSREEHRRISASTTCQNQNDWERISLLINDMTAASETETVVNLLKKLYKELPADTVLWFIKCWLKFPETLENEEKCALSRGDARGRMRRIDGGKGSDKVWRLDTIVGMMFHGMPMSSTDTNIMVHTCDQELCIRPQHLRFKASSVSLVVVLKALQQTGYSIIPPSDENYSNGDCRSSPSDEFVDVSGPFKIEQLQQYRLEELRPCEQSMGKLNSSSTDINLLDTYPLLKNYYPTYSEDLRQNLAESKFGSSVSYNTIRPISGVKRPAQTTSNSTDSPPNISVDGNSHQCQSPPNITTIKLQNVDIIPTPRKADVLPVHRLNSIKKTVDYPAMCLFTKDRESYGQAPDLLAEDRSELKQIMFNETMGTVSRLTNESPVIGLSNNGSGKNTPRQPAKKRLEARTPTLFCDDPPAPLPTMSSPIDHKNRASGNGSAFRIVQQSKYQPRTIFPSKTPITPNMIITTSEAMIQPEIKQEFETCEIEMSTIFPINAGDGKNDDFPFGSCYPNNLLLCERKDLRNGKLSELELEMYKKKNEMDAIRTSQSLEYLLKAISSQTPGLSTPCDPMPIQSGNPNNESNHIIGSSITNGQRTPLNSNITENGVNNNSSRISLSTSSTVSYRFTPEQASLMLNVLCNSPLGNNNPELIEMIYSMMQQYGINNPAIIDGANYDHTNRPDSVILRRQIYHHLCKDSPQIEGLSSTPISNEISNEDPIPIGSSPCQTTHLLHKSTFNPFSTIRDTIHTAD